MATTLVLWDIDHTLIETRGVGGQVYAEAFAKVTGRYLAHLDELRHRGRALPGAAEALRELSSRAAHPRGTISVPRIRPFGRSHHPQAPNRRARLPRRTRPIHTDHSHSRIDQRRSEHP